MRRILFVPAMMLVGVHAAGQSIANVRAEINADKVLITYDLDGKPDQRYNISLYGSHNNFSSPLRLVTGSVGEGQVAGRAKVVEWRIGEELVTYVGQITFRLRGEVMAAGLRLQSPSANSVVKIGKKKEITWTGGKANQSVRIELLQDGRVVNVINESASNGSFVWNVPKDIQKGNYQIRLLSGSENTSPQAVQLKAGLPLWVKLSPILLAGVAVILFLPDDPVEPPPPPEADLPNAPRPN
jgi:hypothetical protein